MSQNTPSINDLSDSSNSQHIVLQNTDENKPIQLKINAVTDYTALSITVISSIIISIVTAAITILLVKNSNKSLLSGQLEQQKILLSKQTEQLQQQLDHQLSIQKNELKHNNLKELIHELRTLLSSLHTSLDNVAVFTTQLFRIRLASKFHPNNDNYSLDKIEKYGEKTTELFDTIRFSANQLEIILDSNTIPSEELKKLINNSVKFMTDFYSEVDRDFLNEDLNNMDELNLNNMFIRYESLRLLTLETNKLKKECIVVLRNLVTQLSN